MSFPKKGKFFPKNGRRDQSGGNSGPPTDGSEFAAEIAAALAKMLRDRKTPIKAVAGWTGANERTVKNWVSGQYGPRGAHLVVLMRHSEEVLNSVLSMAGLHDRLVAQKLAAMKQHMLELSPIMTDLIRMMEH
jgi:hypothetical protein